MPKNHKDQRKLVSVLMGIATERQWRPSEHSVVEHYLFTLHARIAELEQANEALPLDPAADAKIAQLEAELARLKAEEEFGSWHFSDTPAAQS